LTSRLGNASIWFTRFVAQSNKQSDKKRGMINWFRSAGRQETMRTVLEERENTGGFLSGLWVKFTWTIKFNDECKQGVLLG
jgi:hypothetical protein